ncbi:putative aspartyl aminopeptidase [Helianthus annuus]|nr:putative aspartyl aminopeptidase [Helianthus annuus]KAJ0742542.1 putative aspartyl aminopeptidase [Helianthus annuus]
MVGLIAECLVGDETETILFTARNNQAQVRCKPDDICDFELQACDTQPSVIAGAMKEFIFFGRLDNLCMSFCSLKALIDATVSEKVLKMRVV